MTLIDASTVSDRAVGLSTLSHTNTVAVYDPESPGIHDNAGLNDCPAASEPVIHASETVTPYHPEPVQCKQMVGLYPVH